MIRDDGPEHPLFGEDLTVGIVRVGDTVRRPRTPESDLVEPLSLYLEEVGFAEAPRFLGVDSSGRQALSYLDGEVAGRPWPDWVADDERIAVWPDSCGPTTMRSSRSEFGRRGCDHPKVCRRCRRDRRPSSGTWTSAPRTSCSSTGRGRADRLRPGPTDQRQLVTPVASLPPLAEIANRRMRIGDRNRMAHRALDTDVSASGPRAALTRLA